MQQLSLSSQGKEFTLTVYSFFFFFLHQKRKTVRDYVVTVKKMKKKKGDTVNFFQARNRIVFFSFGQAISISKKKKKNCGTINS